MAQQQVVLVQDPLVALGLALVLALVLVLDLGLVQDLDLVQGLALDQEITDAIVSPLNILLCKV